MFSGQIGHDIVQSKRYKILKETGMNELNDVYVCATFTCFTIFIEVNLLMSCMSL